MSPSLATCDYALNLTTYLLPRVGHKPFPLPPLDMPSGHLARQLRFVIPGAAITYWLHTLSIFARIWADAASLARFVSPIPVPVQIYEADQLPSFHL
jgi:hypothetical protein